MSSLALSARHTPSVAAVSSNGSLRRPRSCPRDVSGAFFYLTFSTAPACKPPPPPSFARHRLRSTTACNNEETRRRRQTSLGVACRARAPMFRVEFDGQGVRRAAVGRRYVPRHPLLTNYTPAHRILVTPRLDEPEDENFP